MIKGSIKPRGMILPFILWRCFLKLRLHSAYSLGTIIKRILTDQIPLNDILHNCSAMYSPTPSPIERMVRESLADDAAI